MDLYSKLPHSKSGADIRNEFLTSSAWNALIHHPVEDSDQEDLPSTVDIDAIKDAPGTPITGQVVHWNITETTNKDNSQTVDESSSDDENVGTDSATRSSSGSDSEDSDSGSCSWSSSSSSRSSSCSSPSPSPSETSSPARQTFSIRETNFDQGGLKLKLSALKVARKGKSSRSQTGTESDSCSSHSQDKSKFNKMQLEEKVSGNKSNKISSKVTFSKTVEYKRVVRNRNYSSPETNSKGTKDNSTNQKKMEIPIKNSRNRDKRSDIKNTETKGSVIVKPKTENIKSMCGKVETPIEGVTRNVKIGETKLGNNGTCLKTLASLKRYDSGCVKRETEIPKIQPLTPAAKKISETSKLRSVRRKPGLTQAQPTVSKGTLEKSMNKLHKKGKDLKKQIPPFTRLNF